MPYGISNRDGQTSATEVTAILHLARGKGIHLIDTAFAYGNAEKVLGRNDLTTFDIVSKFRSLSKGESPLSQLSETLSALRVNAVYGYLAHRAKDVVDFPNCWDDLQTAKLRGLVKKIGFSLNEPQELELIGKRGIKPDLIQVPFNFLDRRFESAMIELKQNGCEIHSRSTFLQGLFFVPLDLLPNFFDSLKPILAEIRNGTKDLAGSLLKFVLSRSFIDKVILGVNNSTQLRDNLESALSASTLSDVIYNLPTDIITPSKWPKN